MKNLNLVQLFTVLSPLSPLSKVYATSIAKLQKRINTFDHAIMICNEYQDSEKFFDLTKKAMKSFSDKKKAIKEKIAFYCDILSKVSQKSLQVVNENTPLKPSAKMYSVEYYRDIAEKYNIPTNMVETIKKFYTTAFITLAKLEKAKVEVNELPTRALYEIAFGAIHHSHHQQSCNCGEWLEYYNQGNCKVVIDSLGYNSSYSE